MRCWDGPTFQYQKGAIKTGNPKCQPDGFECHFNTKKVRLKPGSNLNFDYRAKHFNTKKVRLKRKPGKTTKATKTNFNTKKVRLKLKTVMMPVLVAADFNTKKVRLKPYQRYLDQWK